MKKQYLFVKMDDLENRIILAIAFYAGGIWCILWKDEMNV